MILLKNTSISLHARGAGGEECEQGFGDTDGSPEIWLWEALRVFNLGREPREEGSVPVILFEDTSTSLHARGAGGEE